MLLRITFYRGGVKKEQEVRETEIQNVRSEEGKKTKNYDMLKRRLLS